jgi:CheY-like chemotaxis protein
MDLSMPVMDGLEATKRIRNLDSESSGVPIVAMTANAFQEDMDNCFEVGMNDFMPKPINAESLVAHVVKWTNTDSVNTTPLSKTASEQANEQPTDLRDLDLNGDPGEHAADGQWMDLAVLKTLERETAPELVQEIIGVFKREITENMVALSKAGELANLDAIVAEAHAIKSIAGTFGALSLQNASSVVESVGLEGDIAESIAAINALAKVAEQTIKLYSSRY